MTDLLLTNGKIYTMNPAKSRGISDPTRPHANAIAFANGRVVAFDDAARAMRDVRTEVIDLRGRAAIPGLVDSHIHFTGYAMSIARVQLDGTRSLDEAVARVAARVRSAKPGEVILGMAWNHLDWAEPVFPTKAPLDAVAPDNPVVLDRKDGHSVWLNSAALRGANITRETTDPPGGIIERDAAGEPTGLLRENATALLGGRVGFEGDKICESDLLNAIRTAHKLGLTGIHNVEGANALRAFQNLHAQGKLTLRVTQMVPVENLEHAITVGLQTGFGDEFLHIGGVKIFADGSLGSQTAWMIEPLEGQPDHRGIAVMPPEEIERLARAAAQAGLMVCTHAIGDRANREVLNVYEKLRREGLGAVFRIEHAQHLHPADISRFGALNVIASMQPIHATSDYRMAGQLLGTRARYAYAFKSLLSAGATIAFGSDCPVETLDPLAGIHAAVTRERANGEPRGGWYPEERISVEDAVRAYTSPLSLHPPLPSPDGLRQERGEGVQGVWGEATADAIVLSQDIFTIPPREILSTRVDYTIVGGRIVHAA